LFSFRRGKPQTDTVSLRRSILLLKKEQGGRGLAERKRNEITSLVSWKTRGVRRKLESPGGGSPERRNWRELGDHIMKVE